MFSITKLENKLNTKFLGKIIKYKEISLSTNDDSWACFLNNQPEGTLIIADYQKLGRGRRRSKWTSSSGKSLTFSFLLSPKIEFEQLGLLPLLACVSVVRGIQISSNIFTGIKWPNDIMLNRKKIGGILIESRSNNDLIGVVVGIGLNINEFQEDFPEELQNQATSLTIESGEKYDRELILATILNEFENLYLHKWKDIIPLWNDHCIHNNDEITFHTDDNFYRGIFKGISDCGYAQIQFGKKTELFPTGIVIL